MTKEETISNLNDENGAVVTIKTIKGVVKHFLNARKKDGYSISVAELIERLPGFKEDEK